MSTEVKGIRVTATDLENGQSASRVIDQDYVLVCGPGVYQSNITVHVTKDGTQTHVITVKGIKR